MHRNTEKGPRAAGAHGGGYERTDVSIAIPTRFLMGLVVLLLAGIFLMKALFGYLHAENLRKDTPPSPLANELPTDPPLPRLQKTPIQDLNKLHATEKQALENYGWVEQNAGVVRIPIDRAMDLVLERGLPIRKQGEQGAKKR